MTATSRTTITLEMDTVQAMALWDLVGGMKPEVAEKYISSENYERLYTLWKELDTELKNIGLASC